MKTMQAMVILVWLVAAQTALGAEWIYRERADPMTGGIGTAAVLDSENEFELKFPYQGRQRAMLVLRAQPQSGRAVLLAIRRGQFHCRVDDCQLQVRFDDQKPMPLSASPSGDGVSTGIFINNIADFERRLRAAKVLRIQAVFWGNGSQVLEFKVAGLEWSGKAKAGRRRGPASWRPCQRSSR